MNDGERSNGGVPPSEQRGGDKPSDAEARAKGEWAATAQEGVVPAEQGRSDAPSELQAEDPKLESSVLRSTTGLRRSPRLATGLI